jgi:hypothetical protein
MILVKGGACHARDHVGNLFTGSRVAKTSKQLHGLVL